MSCYSRRLFSLARARRQFPIHPGLNAGCSLVEFRSFCCLLPKNQSVFWNERSNRRNQISTNRAREIPWDADGGARSVQIDRDRQRGSGVDPPLEGPDVIIYSDARSLCL